MNDTPGTCVFLSHLRRGMGTAIAAPQNSAPRATIQLTVPIAANGERKDIAVEGLNLVGPGEVLGFDPRVVVRTYPQQDAFDAESNYFPLIEFSHPDLPWRYTPTTDSEGRLLPWFCLIALKDDEFELDSANVGTPEKRLPILTVHPATPLPKLSQCWAWAHVQVSGTDSLDFNKPADPVRLRQILDNEPERVVARLLCPRHLQPKISYTVFVIPTFERGRLIGLPKEAFQEELQKKNLEWKAVTALAQAWTDEDAVTLPRSRQIQLPVYYHWRFQTGEGGDFEYLVDLLIETNKEKNKNSETVNPQKPSVGTRLMDVQTPGAGLPPASATPMGLEGALKVPESGIPWVRKDDDGNELTGDQNIKSNWIAALSEIANWPSTMLSKQHKVVVLSGESEFKRFIHPAATLNAGEINIYTDRVGYDAWSNQVGQRLTDCPYYPRYSFAFTDWTGNEQLDLIAIRKYWTTADIQVLSNFRQFLPQNLPSGVVQYMSAFAMIQGSYPNRPDMVVALKNDNNHTDVQIWSGLYGYRQASLSVTTSLDDLHDRYALLFSYSWSRSNYPDLVAIHKRDGKTEIQVLSAQSNYQEIIVKRFLPLEGGPKSFAFALADWDQDDVLDLVVIQKRTGGIGLGGKAPLPIYGRWHVGANAQTPANDINTHPWFYELNIDPTLRVAAGLGTYIVQTQQQSLMASAWRQVEGIQKINAELRQTQLARETATRIYQSDIVADTHQTRQAEAILNLSAPVHGQVVWTRQPPVDGNPSSEETLRASTQTSRLADGIFDPQWRRIVRGRGPISQRQGRTGASNVLDQMNKDETDPNYLSPAKKPEPPSNILSFKSLGLNLANLDSGQVGGSGGPHEYPPGTPFEQPGEGSWYTFGEAIGNLIADDGWTDPGEPPQPPAIDITVAAKAVVEALDPVSTIEAPCVDRLTGVDRSNGTWQGEDKLSPVMVEPTFPDPMIDPLRELSQDWVLPGLDQVPPNTIALLEPNRQFIEAYMVGLNHEMARELLWNSYPTDQRGSYFRHFWPPTSIVNLKEGTVSPEAQSDITRINEWTRALGQNQPAGKGEALLCLLIRGDLLRRYPNAMIYASRATGSSENPQLISNSNHPNFDERYPLFIGTLKPDVSFLAFNLSEEEVRGRKATDTQPDEPGWFFVLQEQSFEGRFGLDIGSEEDYGQPVVHWDEFSWKNLVTTPDELDQLHYIDLESSNPIINSVTSVSFENGILTFTTALPHWLKQGDQIVISGMNPPEYNGFFEIVSPEQILTPNKFTASISAKSLPPADKYGEIYPATKRWHAKRGSQAAEIASITFQRPVRMAIHASDLLPTSEGS